MKVILLPVSISLALQSALAVPQALGCWKGRGCAADAPFRALLSHRAAAAFTRTEKHLLGKRGRLHSSLVLLIASLLGD